MSTRPRGATASGASRWGRPGSSWSGFTTCARPWTGWTPGSARWTPASARWTRELARWTRGSGARWSGSTPGSPLSSGALTPRLTVWTPKLTTEVGRLDAKIDALDTKVDRLDAKLTTEVGRLAPKIDALDTKVDRLDAKLTAEVGRLDAKIDSRFDSPDGRLATLQTWMVGVVVTAVVAFGGTLAGTQPPRLTPRWARWRARPNTAATALHLDLTRTSTPSEHPPQTSSRTRIAAVGAHQEARIGKADGGVLEALKALDADLVEHERPHPFGFILPHSQSRGLQPWSEGHVARSPGARTPVHQYAS